MVPKQWVQEKIRLADLRENDISWERIIDDFSGFESTFYSGSKEIYEKSRLWQGAEDPPTPIRDSSRHTVVPTNSLVLRAGRAKAAGCPVFTESLSSSNLDPGKQCSDPDP